MKYSTKDIFSTKIINDFGCIYAIRNIKTNMFYIGQTYTFYKRSKDHLHHALRNRGLHVDIEIGKSIDDFEFIVLKTYKDLGITFHNRKIRTIEEHRLIKEYNSNHPNGYNKSFYGSIQFK